VLKGQWLRHNGSPAPKQPKRTRARQINQYGFT
jgi:hypothetical protein